MGGQCQYCFLNIINATAAASRRLSPVAELSTGMPFNWQLLLPRQEEAPRTNTKPHNAVVRIKKLITYIGRLLIHDSHCGQKQEVNHFSALTENHKERIPLKACLSTHWALVMCQAQCWVLGCRQEYVTVLHAQSLWLPGKSQSVRHVNSQNRSGTWSTEEAVHSWAPGCTESFQKARKLSIWFWKRRATG